MQVCELRSGVVAALLADALVAEAVVARECEERKTPAEVISASVAPTVAESRNMCAVDSVLADYRFILQSNGRRGATINAATVWIQFLLLNVCAVRTAQFAVFWIGSVYLENHLRRCSPGHSAKCALIVRRIGYQHHQLKNA